MASQKSQKAVERSVQSLQGLYAIVIALAVAEALRRFLLDRQSGEVLVQWSDWPAFAAFLATVIPFFHGMNRHLEETYTLNPRPKEPKAALLFDFVFFFGEACLLFSLAAMVREGEAFFKLLVLLLFVDVAWAMIVWLIHRVPIWKWGIINLLAAIVILGTLNQQIFEDTLVVVAVIACLRTLADYVFCWPVYFPSVRS
jgi:hypothetical protein